MLATFRSLSDKPISSSKRLDIFEYLRLFRLVEYSQTPCSSAIGETKDEELEKVGKHRWSWHKKEAAPFWCISGAVGYDKASTPATLMMFPPKSAQHLFSSPSPKQSHLFLCGNILVVIASSSKQNSFFFFGSLPTPKNCCCFQNRLNPCLSSTKVLLENDFNKWMY